MTRECGIKAVDDTNEDTNKTAYETDIRTILDDHVAACNPDSTVYTTAVTSFNTNNGHRAAMYEALDKIMCYVDNIDGTNTADNLTTATTDAAACISALSSNYAAKFPAHTTASPACPTRAAYALQISNYESLSLTEQWIPSDTTCVVVAAPMWTKALLLAPTKITSSPQYCEGGCKWGPSNLLAAGDTCNWDGGSQVALNVAPKNYVEIDLERDYKINKVRGNDVANLLAMHAQYSVQPALLFGIRLNTLDYD